MLADEATIYFNLLKNAGVDVVHEVYRNSPHGFVVLDFLSQAGLAINLVFTFLKERTIN